MKTAIIAAALGLALAGTAASAQGVDRRHAYQQDRIGQGVASGRLTPREANHLERQQGRIDRTERRERYANGGHLTPGERARLQRRENRASANIYRKKHNGRYY